MLSFPPHKKTSISLTNVGETNCNCFPSLTGLIAWAPRMFLVFRGKREPEIAIYDISIRIEAEGCGIDRKKERLEKGFEELVLLLVPAGDNQLQTLNASEEERLLGKLNSCHSLITLHLHMTKVGKKKKERKTWGRFEAPRQEMLWAGSN